MSARSDDTHVAIIVGTRPHFIKLVALVPPLTKASRCTIIHTGQHYDYWMYQQFQLELQIPIPDYDLGVGSTTPAVQVGLMTAACDTVLRHEAPSATVVIGDSNSSLAGSLASAKLGIPCVHIEAGARSFDRRQPEEVNRRLIDAVADLMLCSTPHAASNLLAEGHSQERIKIVGDLLIDVAASLRGRSPVRREVVPSPQAYVLVTVHRVSNTDRREALAAIVDAVLQLGRQVIWPLHPRVKDALGAYGLLDRLAASALVHLAPPVSYLEMQELQSNARLILSDSNGIQREAAYLGKPCVILRDSTEYPETVDQGLSILAGADQKRILEASEELCRIGKVGACGIFGDGHAGSAIAREIAQFLRSSRDR